ncbi:MAG: glycosyltransferase family 2 protein [Archaeoglobaceae archaeon]|nr:glycosyltransferase family 2 protein [Archaeoglobaceae archaeon]MCX8152114.1 glycosyltransferase family 2 protein [Archaeoglobaceae archaeon]MDW8013550.1 glycosyltransferase family 2 protein [Archaeoglobaceae archaeon]
MKIALVIPVSPFESKSTVLESVKVLKSLDFSNFEYKIVYVVDFNEECALALKSEGVEVLFRKDNRGKRAGAINDAVDYLSDFNPDYLAIFDVDSRPQKNFLIKCIEALEKCEDCYIASSKRYIWNGINLVTETVEAEYYLINFFLERLKWKQFNGLIGVLKYKILKEEKLNELALTEDADFSTRMHAKGKKALLVKTTKIYEEAPMSWKELYNQRKRWYYGGLQLWKYRKTFDERKVKISWILALTLSYVVILALPLIILAPPLLLYHYKKISKLKLVLGLTVHALLLQIAALDAIFSYLTKKSVGWSKVRRVTEKLNT